MNFLSTAYYFIRDLIQRKPSMEILIVLPSGCRTETSYILVAADGSFLQTLTLQEVWRLRQEDVPTKILNQPYPFNE